jgi:hypothetical protein
VVAEAPRADVNPQRRALITSLILLLVGGVVVGTNASFNAVTSNSASFSTDALNNPSNVVVAAAGNAVTYSWTAGSMTSGGTSYIHRLSTKALQSGSVDGTPPPCAWTDSFPTTSTIPNATTSTSIATAAGSAGAWLCWRLDVQHPASSPLWFSQNSPAGVLKVGHAVASVALANGGTSGTIDQGDTITITFTQPVNKSSGPTDTSGSSGNGVCAYRQGNASSSRIYIGRTSAPASKCASGESPVVGTIGPTDISFSGNTNGSWDASYAWGGTCNAGNTACTQLVVTLGASTQGSDPSVGLTAPLFDPTDVSGKLTSATGTLAICTTTNNLSTPVICHPEITGSF